MKVGVVDYGAGNLRSVCRAIEYAGGEPQLVSTPEAVAACDRLILPGVGAAESALAALRARGLDEALTDTVRRGARPLLGICLGMQLLAERLLEYGNHTGLGWIPGEVVALRDLIDDDSLHVPHMGWNEVAVAERAQPMFARIRNNRFFYFAHSFTLRCPPEYVVNTVGYGTELVAAVMSETVFACQYHPEKSQLNGERLLTAFLNWTP